MKPGGGVIYTWCGREEHLPWLGIVKRSDYDQTFHPWPLHWAIHNTEHIGGDKTQISTSLHSGIQDVKNDCVVFKYDKCHSKVDYIPV